MAESKARNTDPRYAKLAIGVCPDQWGVWFPEDPLQIPWETALAEMAQAGFSIMETGPVVESVELEELPPQARKTTAARGEISIKRIGFLKGLCPDPTEKPAAKSAEEELTELIKARKQKGEA